MFSDYLQPAGRGQCILPLPYADILTAGVLAYVRPVNKYRATPSDIAMVCGLIHLAWSFALEASSNSHLAFDMFLIVNRINKSAQLQYLYLVLRAEDPAAEILWVILERQINICGPIAVCFICHSPRAVALLSLPYAWPSELALPVFASSLLCA